MHYMIYIQSIQTFEVLDTDLEIALHRLVSDRHCLSRAEELDSSSGAMSSRCDVRSVESEEKVVIALRYSADSSLEKHFYFKRNKTETLRLTFARISLNINNLFKKKIKSKNKNTSNAEREPKAISIELMANGCSVSEDALNSDVWKSGQTLRIGDKVYEVFVNAPAVKSIRLSKSIMSSFKAYPIVCLEFCTLNDCQFVWFRRQLNSQIEPELGFDWIEVGKGFDYNVSRNDIGSKLKVICFPKEGIESEAISENTVEANPGLCPFEERLDFCKNNTSFNKFRIISYNILADTYVDSEYSRTFLFPYCPPYALTIDYRKQLLIKEIIGYNADIACLQEVDRQVFDNDLNPIMSSLKTPNTSESKYKSVFSEKGNTGEGLATFYNTSKFELLIAKTISISKELESNPIFAKLFTDVSVNHKLRDRLIARKSVFQCIVLKSCEQSDRAVLVANTHLYFHPDADHIRLIQSYIFVKYLENNLKILRKSRPDLKVSSLVCGDFNSCPEFAVFRLMTTGFVPKETEDFKSNSDETIEGFDMSHDLSLGSACGQPIYTNYTQLFNGCLDYIFFDTNSLSVLEVIPFPSHEQVRENIAIPSVVIPSDHLALVCVLQWINN